MGRNLKYQFKTIVEDNFKEGMNKHSMKVDNSKKDKARSFSFADRKNLIDTSAKFANFMKEWYPEVKMLRDIKSDHIQMFFNIYGSDWSKATIDVRMSHIRKLERMARQTFPRSTFSFTEDIIKPTGKDLSRVIEMSPIDYDILLNAVKKSGSKSRYAVEFAGRFSPRVEEIAELEYRDIVNVGNGVYNLRIIDSKGKHSRILEVTNKADIAFLEQFKGNPKDRIIPYCPGSINKFINRYLGRCGLDIYIKRKTSVHAIRKMGAQRKFDEYRKSGLSRKESTAKVSEYLGHGKDRKALLEGCYIANIH